MTGDNTGDVYEQIVDELDLDCTATWLRMHQDEIGNGGPHDF